MSRDSAPVRRALRSGPPVFISWVVFHGRSEGLAEQVGARTYYFDIGRPRLPVLLRYLANAVATVSVLLRVRPRAVIVMLPPVPVLMVVRAWTALSGAVVVSDMHSGVFNKAKWMWATELTLRFAVGGHAVVTNEPMAETCRRAGLPTLVLHDTLSEPTAPRTRAAEGPPMVLVPLSWDTDEPVREILAAAARRPDLRWVLTGRAPEEYRRAAAEHVEFPGYVSNEEYDQLLGTADVVLALTTREDTLQRAGYEAANGARPLVTSATAALKDFFEDSAVYTEPTADGIGAAVAEALARGPELVERIREVHARRRDEQRTALAELRALVGTQE